jgi:L-threonylcarbamoyladenylate synthase
MNGPREMGRSQMRDDALREIAAQSLVRGEVAIYPTDTLYALGASARSEPGLRRVANLKGRPEGMPMSFAFPEVEDILRWTESSELAESVLLKNLPGPLTVVLPANGNAPRHIINSDGTLGCRVPEDVDVRALLADSGPLSATSANLHGGKDPRHVGDIPEELMAKVDRIIDFGPCAHSRGSTIIKIIGDDISMIREGVLRMEDIKR